MTARRGRGLMMIVGAISAVACEDGGATKTRKFTRKAKADIRRGGGRGERRRDAAAAGASRAPHMAQGASGQGTGERPAAAGVAPCNLCQTLSARKVVVVKLTLASLYNGHMALDSMLKSNVLFILKPYS